MFENIECEWPLFYSYLILFHLFQGNKMSVSDYAHKLEVSTSVHFLYILKKKIMFFVTGCTSSFRRWYLFST